MKDAHHLSGMNFGNTLIFSTFRVYQKSNHGLYLAQARNLLEIHFMHLITALSRAFGTSRCLWGLSGYSTDPTNMFASLIVSREPIGPIVHILLAV